MTNACDLSAVEARRLIGERKLSPVELLKSCLERISATNGAINAMVAMCEDRAHSEAKAAEAAIMRGDSVGLLHGLPIGVKDLERTKDLRTTWGSELFKDHVPTEDAPQVAMLRKAGAIVLGKTNAPEFGAGGHTTNRVYGPTSTPFNADLSAGGSSGGSAAALATCQVPLATGSDYGGSLRTPASFCGVVGFRPSAGVVPHVERTVGLMPWGVLGPMGRSLADAYLMLRAEANVDRRDCFSSDDCLAFPEALTMRDANGLRIAISSDLGCAPVARTVKATFLEKMKRLANHVGAIEQAHPDFAGAQDIYDVFRAVVFQAQHAEKAAKSPHLVGPNVMEDVRRASRYSLADVARAYLEQTALTHRFNAFFEKFDVLIAPAAAVAPFDKQKVTVEEIDGQKMDVYTRWLSITNMPSMALASAVALPAGLDKEGLPFGIQLLGPRGSDATLLRIAASIESLLNQDQELSSRRPDLSKLNEA